MFTKLGSTKFIAILLTHWLLFPTRDGASRSGIFCAASYLLDKMKNDNEVDVFLAVRYVALRRSEFISSTVSPKSLLVSKLCSHVLSIT